MNPGKKSKTQDHHRAHFAETKSAALHHLYMFVCFEFFFSENALGDGPKKWHIFLFSTAYFRTCWHMPFQISIIRKSHCYPSCTYIFICWVQTVPSQVKFMDFVSQITLAEPKIHGWGWNECKIYLSESWIKDLSETAINPKLLVISCSWTGCFPFWKNLICHRTYMDKISKSSSSFMNRALFMIIRDYSWIIALIQGAQTRPQVLYSEITFYFTWFLY